MVGVSGQQQVLGEINLHAVSLANGNGRRDLDELIKHGSRLLRDAGRSPAYEGLRAIGVVTGAALGDLGRARDDAQCNGGAEDLIAQ